MQRGERNVLQCRDYIHDDVVAGPAVEDRRPRRADQHVVSSAAGESVVAGAADQDVVAGAAIGGELHGSPEPRRGDDIVAGEAIDDDAIGCLEPEIVTWAARPDTVTTPLSLIDRDHVVAVGPVDDDRVDLTVAAAAAECAARSMSTC